MATIPPIHCSESYRRDRSGGLPGTDEPFSGALARARAGDTRAFTTLVRAHQRSVYGLALRALGNRAEAEDLAQDAFLQLHLSLDRIESPDHLAYWLRRTVTHRAIDRLRQRRRGLDWERRGEADVYATAAAGESTSASDCDDPLLARRLQLLVAGLPVLARLVVVLRYQEDLDPTEIARVLDLPINTVKSHLRRSLARLRAQCIDRDMS